MDRRGRIFAGHAGMQILQDAGDLLAGHAAEAGGQGFTLFETVVHEETLGRAAEKSGRFSVLDSAGRGVSWAAASAEGAAAAHFAGWPPMGMNKPVAFTLRRKILSPLVT